MALPRRVPQTPVLTHGHRGKPPPATHRERGGATPNPSLPRLPGPPEDKPVPADRGRSRSLRCGGRLSGFVHLMAFTDPRLQATGERGDIPITEMVLQGMGGHGPPPAGPAIDNNRRRLVG